MLDLVASGREKLRELEPVAIGDPPFRAEQAERCGESIQTIHQQVARAVDQLGVSLTPVIALRNTLPNSGSER